MRRLQLRHATIRQRVLVITLLPLMLITLILGSYFINTQLQEAEEALLERGKTMSMLMGSAAEFGLLTGNADMLASLIRGPSKEIDVSDIVFLDREFSVILRSDQYGGEISRDEAYPYSTGKEIFFLQPVITTGIDVLDSPEFASEEAEPEIIGWVAIALSRLPTQRRQQEIILKGVSIALFGFIITLFIAARFGRRITNPILGLTQVVKLLEKGRLDARSTIQTTGELQTLSRGINRLAERVQESNQTLESRVERATKRVRSTLFHLEKQNLELSTARKKADSANRAKDEFLARMSHELRTPLTSVLGFARLLDVTELHPEQKEYTRIINLTSSLLLSIIDDILDFSKLQSNAIKLEKLSLNMESLVYDIVEMQSPAAHSKGIELIPVVSPDVPPELLGDPMRLRQILTNLVSNAIKFTNQGHVAIHVNVEEVHQGRVKLLLQVDDTGIGIPKSRIRHLFQAFSQADSSITRKFGGSGLGLVIAKLLAELMGGGIRLRSEEENGTSISVNVPLSLPQSAPAPADLHHGGEVLVYDQHPLNRRNLKYQLHQWRPAPQFADSFEDMLQKLTDTQPESVIWSLEPGATQRQAFNAELCAICEVFEGTILLLVCEHVEGLTLPQQVRVLHKPARTQTLIESLLPGHPAALPVTPVDEKPQIPIRVLVAEDNEFNRLLIRRILEQSGAEIVETSNGEEAIRQSQKESFDLILMDVHMPKVDGIQATSTIRLQNPDIPIVALTANVIVSEHRKLLSAGANRVLLKPINDKELTATLAELTQEGAPPVTLDVIENGARDSVSLADYQISKKTLHRELVKQLAGICHGFESNNLDKMRHHSHQLLGLAGLYELPELEVAGIDLSRSLKQGTTKEIWETVWRLQRMIDHGQY